MSIYVKLPDIKHKTFRELRCEDCRKWKRYKFWATRGKCPEWDKSTDRHDRCGLVVWKGQEPTAPMENNDNNNGS